MGYFSEIKPVVNITQEETKSRIKSNQIKTPVSDFLDIITNKRTEFYVDIIASGVKF